MICKLHLPLSPCWLRFTNNKTMTIKINGEYYVKENKHRKIHYSDWSPRAFVIGFAIGSAITSIVLLCLLAGGGIITYVPK